MTMTILEIIGAGYVLIATLIMLTFIIIHFFFKE